MTPALRAAGMTVRFGGVQALRDIDIEVRDGQLVGLIGPNGAGKTTFIDAVTGFVGASGRVLLGGRDISHLPPHARARAGLSRTWQTSEIFDDLSVRENVTVASRPLARRPSLRELVSGRRTADPIVGEALSLVELDWAAELMPADLTQSQHTLVGVARAIVMQPRVLLLDEPAAGLDSSESRELGRTLRRLVDAGTAMLLIDHDVALVLSLCDYIYVVEFGRLIAQGPPDVVRRDPLVIEAYLGSSAERRDA